MSSLSSQSSQSISQEDVCDVSPSQVKNITTRTKMDYASPNGYKMDVPDPAVVYSDVGDPAVVYPDVRDPADVRLAQEDVPEVHLAQEDEPDAALAQDGRLRCARPPSSATTSSKPTALYKSLHIRG